jgi:alpha-L-rhamnosidase
MAPAPRRLQVEHLEEPLGLDLASPRLSWQLTAPSTRQEAYRREVGAWSSGLVESDQCVLVPYDGPAIGSRTRVSWRVQVRTDAGISEWSAPSWWETGLLRADDWSAQWISPVEADPLPVAGERPAAVLRTRFTVGAHSSARIYATAHGLYELFLDGERVGDQELTPGYTSYRSRVQVQTYDIDGVLGEGEHELRTVLSDGWYRGKVGFTREHDSYGSRLALLAQVEVDGTVVAATDGSWTSATGSITAADLIDGESVDQRVHDDALVGQPVAIVEGDFGALCASPAPPVRRVELLRPRSVRELAPGRHVVDLGQNVNGWVRLADPGPAGTELVLTFGEALDAGGDVTQDHIGSMDFVTQTPLPLGQIDRVVSDGSGTPFEPRHTTHGFQYVRVEGHAGPLTEDDVTGVVVHTDLRRTGWFACSDARLNQLHLAADWSFRTNACDIPTDCPQRERAGWTGDWQLFSPTAAFLYDVAGFSTKWVRDLAADQRKDGVVHNFAPEPTPPDAPNEIRDFLEGSSGWGDASVLVPWETWRAYADRRLLEEQWPSMVAWVDYVITAARDHRHGQRVLRNETPEPHEQFLWDTGWHWGEWCEPDLLEDDHFQHFAERDFAIVATAFFAYTTRTLAAIALLIGRDDDAARYDELSANVVDAWQREFVADDGTIRTERQADVVRALAFDLVPDDTRTTVADQLVAMVRAADTHLNTGFLATPYLLPMLADSGHLDLAYELLFQDTPPSWLAMIDRGATTIWEHWDGIDDDGVAHASLNHYSKGAVISFLHRYVAGIQLLDEGPAYRRFRVAPRPGGGLKWASAALESPYGRIESSWTTGATGTTFTVQVPPNTEAEVVLPDGRTTVVGPGTATFHTS